MRTLVGSIKPEDKHISFGSKTLPQIMFCDHRTNVGIQFDRFTYQGMLKFVHIYYIGSYE